MMKVAERESLKSFFFALAVSTTPLSIWSCLTSHDAISSSQIVVEKLLADAERDKVVQMASGQWARRWLADDL